MSSETMKNNVEQLRDKMHEMLMRCTPEQQNLFGRMYNHEGKHSRHVDGVKENQMDWAFQQIERTLYK